MAQDNYSLMLQQMTEDQRRQQQHIDTLTAQMKPLAQTSAGQFALQDKLADQSAPKEERAAAAQALAPGFAVSIGKYGELSFSAAPMQDMGQPAGQSFEQGQVQNNVTAGKQSTFMSNFDSVYTEIANEKDPLIIAQKAGQLSGELANVVASKEAGIRNRLAQSLGITNLESQIQASTEDDRRLYAANGMSYGGPTDETWQLINQRDQMTGRMDSMVSAELGKDPEIANIKTRMGALDTLISQKQSLAGRAMAGAEDTVGASIDPARIASVRKVLNVPDTPETNKEIRERLVAGAPQYLKAEQIASAPAESLLVMSANGGVEGPMAERVLAEQLGDPKLAVYLRDQVKNFDTSKMSPEERAQYEVSSLDKMSTDKFAQAQQAIQAKKAQKVLQNLQVENGTALKNGATKLGESGGWSTPNDPLLAEIPQIVADIKQSDPNEPISINKLLSRMNWDDETKAAKIKAMSNYIYAQANTLPGAKAFGLPVGYRSAQEVEQLVQAKVVSDRWSRIRDIILPFTSGGAISTGIKGTVDNAGKLLGYSTIPLAKRAIDSYLGD